MILISSQMFLSPKNCETVFCIHSVLGDTHGYIYLLVCLKCLWKLEMIQNVQMLVQSAL